MYLHRYRNLNLNNVDEVNALFNQLRERSTNIYNAIINASANTKPISKVKRVNPYTQDSD